MRLFRKLPFSSSRMNWNSTLKPTCSRIVSTISWLPGEKNLFLLMRIVRYDQKLRNGWLMDLEARLILSTTTAWTQTCWLKVETHNYNNVDCTLRLKLKKKNRRKVGILSLLHLLKWSKQLIDNQTNAISCQLVDKSFLYSMLYSQYTHKH